MDNLALITQLKISLWNLTYESWKTETLFSTKWWSLIILNIIGYTIWWKIIDKSRLSQLILFGSFIAVGRIVMDIIGTNTVLWSYTIREIPFFPSPFVHDFTITPLTLMVVYQYSPTWRKFLVWTTVATGIISFGFFPLLAFLGFLELHNWNYFYSFVLVILLATLSRAVLLGILQLEKNHQPSFGYSNSSSRNCIGQPAMKPLNTEEDNTDPRNS